MKKAKTFSAGFLTGAASMFAAIVWTIARAAQEAKQNA